LTFAAEQSPDARLTVLPIKEKLMVRLAPINPAIRSALLILIPISVAQADGFGPGRIEPQEGGLTDGVYLIKLSFSIYFSTI